MKSNVINIDEKLKDYTCYRPAALRLVQKIRAYWNERGYEPEINLVEELTEQGQKMYCIRSDIWTNGPNKMSKYYKPRVKY